MTNSVTILKNGFKILKNISIFPITNKTTNVVKDFYYEEPFPNYNDNDSKFTLLDKGDKNLFINSLKKEIKYGKVVLEAGSGTSQLSIYLAIGTNNQIYALDGSIKSLELASEFVTKNDIKNIKLVNADLLELDNIFFDQTFDYIWSNGVLHHTENPKLCFNLLVKKLKKNGIIIIGLYNSIGRLRTIFRKYLFRIFGKKVVIVLDPYLRELSKNYLENEKKIKAWINDQYLHPIESLHTYGQILQWFKENSLEFINCYPNLNIEKNNNYFEKNIAPNFFERVFIQISMLFTKFGSEGGLFIFIGKKN
jgi:ubiquinone/menaquinone biosynthesis C-methylase UbiE